MKHNVVISILLLTLLMFDIASLKKASARDDIDVTLAEFIYNMPALTMSNNHTLCVYGYDYLTVILDERHGDLFYIKDKKQLAQITKADCNVLYVAKDKERFMIDISKIGNDNQIITVGVFDNFVEEGGIILTQMGRRNLEATVNHKKIKAFGVKFNPMLSNLIIN